MSRAVADLNNSAAMWVPLPLPLEANVRPPGCALPKATNSATLLAATAVCTTRRLGDTETCEIGAKSFAGSYVRSCLRDPLCGDVAGGASHVVDHDRLLQCLGQLGRRLKLRDLQILAAVVQWGSMAKAASHLAMSQPAVSESVANLEDALRVRLLDRSARGIQPTLYAYALLKRGRVVFDELRQALSDLEFLANPTVGEVRVSAGDTLAARLLPEVISRLSRRHPDIVVRVVQANADRQEFRELRERTIDVALARTSRSFAEEDLEVEILFDESTSRGGRKAKRQGSPQEDHAR
jgi:molybdenum-dependent DNA-binding transcriptional regulator ModE